jgi:hypothetical protein
MIYLFLSKSTTTAVSERCHLEVDTEKGDLPSVREPIVYTICFPIGGFQTYQQEKHQFKTSKKEAYFRKPIYGFSSSNTGRCTDKTRSRAKDNEVMYERS